MLGIDLQPLIKEIKEFNTSQKQIIALLGEIKQRLPAPSNLALSEETPINKLEELK
jgi:hypothetical protein